ncbi:MAG: DegT/DnrJ/EryC1/StrS family aminotransferase [Leptolyngbyaceae cyanobacterium T60_A2020_046]|nr:DegT/DnrJ/EryC1/StrS family aminotransferase [Leptolyngbyaceae cyanobacterium T60_A2020_046]
MISLNHFQAEPESLIRAELDAVESVLRSGWYVLGDRVQTFEDEWSKSCGTRFAIGVGNGMDAIEIGLRALGIGSGDEVITTSMTAFATVLGILRAGATPVLADIDLDTGLIHIDSAQRCITSRTKAVLLVHLYGRICNMADWVQFCQQQHLYLLEDCAQSHLASWDGKVAGSFGEWGAYSFYPTKNLGARGDGGALVTNSDSINDQAKILRNYGQDAQYHHEIEGLNSRLDELQAALLSVRIKWLMSFTDKRRAIADAYYSGIDNPGVKLLRRESDRQHHVYHLFVIQVESRDKLLPHLRNHNIRAGIHYPIPIHHQPVCRTIQYDPNGLAAATTHAQHCLSLPCHPQMSDSEITTVIEAVNAFRP